MEHIDKSCSLFNDDQLWSLCSIRIRSLFRANSAHKLLKSVLAQFPRSGLKLIRGHIWARYSLGSRHSAGDQDGTLIGMMRPRGGIPEYPPAGWPRSLILSFFFVDFNFDSVNVYVYSVCDWAGPLICSHDVHGKAVTITASEHCIKFCC